jgi:hypothetical protein
MTVLVDAAGIIVAAHAAVERFDEIDARPDSC